MIPNYEDFKLGNAQVNKIYLGDDPLIIGT